MHDQRNDGETSLLDEDEVGRIILGLLLERHPALVEIDELVRQLAHPMHSRPVPEAFIHDGLLDLASSGLIHRLDRFRLPDASSDSRRRSLALIRRSLRWPTPRRRPGVAPTPWHLQVAVSVLN
jgi:hypothetical protein